MTAALFNPPAPLPPPAMPSLGMTGSERAGFASSLKQQTIAYRVKHEKLGVRKALTPGQKRQMAETFDADEKSLSAGKKLLDTSNPAFRRVVRIRSHASSFFKSMTTPYPDPGVRLLRRDAIEQFESRMNQLRGELTEAAEQLQQAYPELREQARQQLGDLFNDADYPPRVDIEFSLSWEPVNIDPPALLKQIHPHLYQQEVERVQGKFEEAVRLAEQAFVNQFHELIAHLAERLSGTGTDSDGKPKIFRDTAVSNLNAFFEQFRNLDVGSNAQLQRLVDQAQQAVAGVTPDLLRDDTGTRATVASAMSEVQTALDALMVTQPKRLIRLEDDE